MQVAVALADPSNVPPGVEAPGVPIERRTRLGRQALAGGDIENTRTLLGKAPRGAIDDMAWVIDGGTELPWPIAS